MNRRRWLLNLATLIWLAARPWRTRAAARQAPGPSRIGIVPWFWSGGLTSTSVTVVARIVDPVEPVQLSVQPAAGGAPMLVDAIGRPAADGVYRFVASGLHPATAYTYHLVQDGGVWPSEGQFRTLPAGSGRATVLFGSCASTGSNARIWDTMREIGPDLFVHMGDFHYENITANDPARFRAAVARCLTSPRQGRFYRSVPIAYVWDDHDFGDDDSDRLSPSAGAAHQVYREYVPHYPLTGGATGSIQQAFDIGRVRVIVTDPRSARDPASRGSGAAPSMLGIAQRQWLLDELEAASGRAALVVWVNGVPWITKADESTKHGWAPYHEERALIANHIHRLGLTSRLLMLSGDAHMVAIDDGTNSQYAPEAPDGSRGFVVAHAAALDRFRRHKGGPYRLGSRAGRGQFGELRIEDSGERLVATVTCRDSHGRQIRQLSVRMTCVNGSCSVSFPEPHELNAQGAA